MKHAPIALVILDGFGFRADVAGNAPAQAAMPHFSQLCRQYPTALLHAAGPAVGLPAGFQGNSEVGHLTLGAGRIIESPLVRLNAWADRFDQHPVFAEACATVIQHKTTLHLMGLLSDGGVHSHQKHLYGLICAAAQLGVKKVMLHLFLDGRDCPPQSAARYLDALAVVCKEQRVGTIATLHGRWYAMDRDANWDRTRQSAAAMLGKKAATNVSWQQIIEKSYAAGKTDEFIEPILLDAAGILHNNDVLLCFNFRPDRSRQIVQALTDSLHAPVAVPRLAQCVTAADYYPDERPPKYAVLIETEIVRQTLLDVLSAAQYRTFAIAETEKYAHITYFFCGHREQPLSHVQRVLIPSLKKVSYKDDPAMSAAAITERVVQALQHNEADFYLINYANADMVGHSGDLASTITACAVLDEQIGILYDQIVVQKDGTLILVGDHGNAEEKFLPDGSPRTSHTTNPVPFVLANKAFSGSFPPLCDLTPTLGLAHVAPTILTLLKLPIPSGMETKTIIQPS